MKTSTFIVTVSMLAAGIAVPVYAQKGTGAQSGVASQAIKPTLLSVEGIIKEIKSGTCEKTTGRARVGTHLILQTPENKTINVHLGPSMSEEVKAIVSAINTGSDVKAMAFQTARLPKDQFVATSVTVSGKVLPLRDSDLRPLWAAGAGTGRGRGMGRMARGPCY